MDGYGTMWVVALIGRRVVYYNHFEHGFNASRWTAYGVIDDYQSMQSELDEAVQRQFEIVRTGYDIGPWTSGPIPGKYPDA